MKVKGSKRHFALLIAFIFTLSCLFPVQIALALKDCGEHEIVSCDTHNDEHFVALHVSDAAEVAKSTSSDALRDKELPQEEHDASHQIEKGKLAVATAASVSVDNTKIGYLVESAGTAVLTANLMRTGIRPTGPPLITNAFLAFLPSIRLQV